MAFKNPLLQSHRTEFVSCFRSDTNNLYNRYCLVIQNGGYKIYENKNVLDYRISYIYLTIACVGLCAFSVGVRSDQHNEVLSNRDWNNHNINHPLEIQT